MTDKAIQHLVLREGCKPVGLSAFRVKDAMQQPNAKQAVFCVVEKALYSPKSGISSKSSYLITDVRATRARLSASTESFRPLIQSGFDVRGKVIILMNPTSSTDQNTGDLAFHVQSQQGIVVLGTLKHMDNCSAYKKDGSPCSIMVDTSFSPTCMYHRKNQNNSTLQDGPEICAPHATGTGNVPKKFNMDTGHAVNTSQHVRNGQQAVDLLDIVLGKALTASRSDTTNDCFRIDQQKNAEPLRDYAVVTLDDSDSSDEGLEPVMHHSGRVLLDTTHRGSTVIPPSTGGSSVSQISSNGWSSRRDGSVIVPTQSSVFGAMSSHVQQARKGPISQTSASQLRDGGDLSRASSLLSDRHQSNQQLSNPLLSSMQLVAAKSGMYEPTASKPQRTAFVRRAALKDDNLVWAGETLLIDKNKLIENAKSLSDVVTGAKRKAEDMTRDAAVYRKKAIDDLLSRKSSHAEEERDEWFDHYSKRLDKMQWREKKLQQENEKTMVMVKAFHCKECNSTLERPNDYCRVNKHLVTTVSAAKRYFECQNCRRRDYTLGNQRLPDRACSHCGSYNFISTGKLGSGTSKNDTAVGLMGERLVTATTDWTSRADRTQLARGLGNLDYAK